jgi:hypothetical protein
MTFERYAPMRAQTFPPADGDAGTSQTIRAMRQLIEQGKSADSGARRADPTRRERSRGIRMSKNQSNTRVPHWMDTVVPHSMDTVVSHSLYTRFILAYTTAYQQRIRYCPFPLCSAALSGSEVRFRIDLHGGASQQ